MAQRDDGQDDDAPQKTPARGRKKTFTPIALSDDGLELVEAVSLDCTSADGPWTADAEVRIDKKGHATGNGAAPIAPAKGKKAARAFWDGAVHAAWVPVAEMLRDDAEPMAFDHAEILRDGVLSSRWSHLARELPATGAAQDEWQAPESWGERG